MSETDAPLLAVEGLTTHYVSARGTRVTRAVEDVSFTLGDGETLGIVGESGSGKTTLALSLLRLLPPAARTIAIACGPRLLIADEPTTSLDVTIQAQYLSLLRELQRAQGLALIFITHNLGIVARMCDKVAVMYGGRIVESGPVRRIFGAPAHPYTRALIESIPKLGDSNGRLTAIDGQPPDPAALPGGCAFHPRCPARLERCAVDRPHDTAVGDEHRTACWLHG